VLFNNAVEVIVVEIVAGYLMGELVLVVVLEEDSDVLLA
jgi:hypothetical protein